MPEERDWAPPAPYDLRRSLLVLRRGPYDPSYRTGPGGEIWRATRTPDGPATLRIAARPDSVHATGWGVGASWALDQLPAMLGAHDEPDAFTAHHPVVADAAHRHPGLRLIRTGLVLESLIPSVLEQKVTTQEAYRAWQRLLRRHGEPAPGPQDGLHVMPSPHGWARVPSWEWHRAGVDSKRSATIMRAVRLASRMEQAAAMSLPDAMARLQAVPGVGPWTAAETLQRSNGAPDAVSTGDLHLPGLVGYALTGVRGADDARMLELLAPYAGQRYRATRLILLSGRLPARRAPRFSREDIARL